jgi:homoserine dehydrogenase
MSARLKKDRMRKIRVGIAGFGTVGRGTAEAIAANLPEIEARTGAKLGVSAICRRSSIPVESAPEGARVLQDWRQLVAADDVDVVVEAIGGTADAHGVVRSALELGKPVVTANKNLLAEHGDSLFELAREKNVPIGIEASVAGAVPIIRVLAQAVCGDKLQALRGILNGTSNYILTRMQNDGLSFAEALALAQQAGYAEADPSMDIDGIDSRDKLCILARIAFRCRLLPLQIATRGIRQITAVDITYARELNATIRLLAVAEPSGKDLEVSVSPWLVSRKSILSNVEDAHNAVLVVGERSGTHMLYGRGAGGGPTGIAVLSDLMQIAADAAGGSWQFRGSFAPSSRTVVPCSPRRRVPWYLRLTVNDRPGIVARVTDALAKHGANIDCVLQHPGMKKQELSFVITLEPMADPEVSSAAADINRMDFMIGPVLALPILES